MSYMQVTVEKIITKDSLCLVQCRFENSTLRLVTLELNEEIKEGIALKLSVKSTHVAIGKNLQGALSYANQLDTVITQIVHGELLCSLTLRTQGGCLLESLITEASAQRLDLHEGEHVTALIKATELSIWEVLA